MMAITTSSSINVKARVARTPGAGSDTDAPREPWAGAITAPINHEAGGWQVGRGCPRSTRQVRRFVGFRHRGTEDTEPIEGERSVDVRYNRVSRSDRTSLGSPCPPSLRGSLCGDLGRALIHA